ncbi:MAG: hypothetical protein SFW65_00135 [Alphaproteobacteria bacterium]|nr:hypothetical protein [Alphaproteobacteria bacterium]
MSLFLSTSINKVDKKGRVSVPSTFRAALGDDVHHGIVIFRSLQVDALDACSLKHLDILSQSLERLSLTPEMYELIETTIFGGSVQCAIDADGRIIIPEHFMEAVGIDDEAAFVGRRRTFQIWNPKKFKVFENKARDAVRSHNISLSKIIADASALSGGEG